MSIRTLAACCAMLALTTMPGLGQLYEVRYRHGVDLKQPPENDPGWKLGHTRRINSVDYSPDGRLIASAGEDHSLRFWDVQTGQLVRTIHLEPGTPYEIHFTPDASAILAKFDKAAGIWPVSSDGPVALIRGETVPDFSLWLPGGTTCVGTLRHAVVVMDRNLRTQRTFPTKDENVRIWGQVLNGSTAVCLGWNDAGPAKPFAIDLKTGARVHGWFDALNVFNMEFSPDGKYAVSIELDDTGTVRDAHTGAVLKRLELDRRGHIRFSSDGKKALLFTFVPDYSTYDWTLFDTSTWKPLSRTAGRRYVNANALSQDGSRAVIVGGDEDQVFQVCSTTTGKVILSSTDPYLILSSKPTLPLLKQLADDYGRFGLPLPPASAQLATVTWPGPPVSGKANPQHRYLALVENVKKDGSRVYWSGGFGPWPVYSMNVVESFDPAHTTLREAHLKDEGRRADDVTDVTMAIFLYRRGWNSLALECLARKLNGYRDDIRQEFARSAWWHWEGSLTEPTSDRARAARYLHVIFDSSQRLHTDSNKALLADLDFTVKAPKIVNTGIEAEIDALSEMPQQDPPMGQTPWNLRSEPEKAPPPLRSLWLQGFEAVPALLSHLEDRRLCRATNGWIPVRQSEILRVGELAAVILSELAGPKEFGPAGQLWGLSTYEREPAKIWWERARVIGEEKYLVTHVMPTSSQYPVRPNAHNATIIAHKYPHRLPAIYQELSAKYPTAMSAEISDLLAQAKVPEAEKVQQLVRTAAGAEKDQRVSALWALVHMKYPKTLDLIISRMGHLPSTPEGPFWLAEAGILGRMVQEIDDARGWNALERLARRSVPGQRLEILHRLGNVFSDKARERHTIEFQARFLNDNTMVDFAKETGFGGPHADFDLHRITIRDSVLRHVCFDVGVKAYPLAAWTPKDWDSWRPEVVAGLKLYLAEAKTGR